MAQQTFTPPCPLVMHRELCGLLLLSFVLFIVGESTSKATTMFSPTALAIYTFVALWLAFKYRILLQRKSRVVGELATALSVAFAVVVVPNVTIGETAWCPDVQIPTVAAIALVISVAAPLFNSILFPPVLAITSAGFTVAYLCQTQCWGVATIVVGAGMVHALIYIYDITRINREQP